MKHFPVLCLIGNFVPYQTKRSAGCALARSGNLSLKRPRSMNDPEIRLIVKLTPAHVHYSVIRKALEHGKHVYTEKTLTDELEKSEELVRLAREKGLYLASAPDTFMGAALQTARDAIDRGMLARSIPLLSPQTGTMIFCSVLLIFCGSRAAALSVIMACTMLPRL